MVGSGKCAATVECSVPISVEDVLDFIAVIYWDKMNPESEMEPYKMTIPNVKTEKLGI